MFDAVCPDLVANVLNGVNATVFAYGPTGAGKTRTMTGTAAEPGVMVLALQQMFDRIKVGGGLPQSQPPSQWRAAATPITV